MERAAFVFFRAYVALVVFLNDSGAPDWLVNLPRKLIPDALMAPCARIAWRHRSTL